MPGFIFVPTLSYRSSVKRLFVFLTAVLVLQGCSSSPANTADPSFQRKYGHFDYCSLQAVKQNDNYTCGPACLSAVMQYWGVEMSERQIAHKYPSRQEDSYFLFELRSIAAAEGLEAYVFSMQDDPYDELAEQILKGRPVICVVSFPTYQYLFEGVPVFGNSYKELSWTLGSRKDHMIVVVGLKSDKVLIMDPMRGFTQLPWRHFEGAWSRMKYACLLISD